ncbi:MULTISPECIES: glycosyltransferase family 4 protein [unclassified Bradyrhizobium]
MLTHDPSLAFWAAAFVALFRMKIIIFAHAFNFTIMPTGFKLWILRLAFRRVDCFAVFSQVERDMYSKIFRIDRARFDFVHWGVNPPTMTSPNTPLIAGNYFSAVGGNSRDYRTLIEAARLVPNIRFVLVARPENLSGLEIPRNVVVRTNIPFGDAMNILGFSNATIVPLDRADAPCGHVTIVAAMYLGVPVVATRSTGIEDYIHDGETGILVDPKSSSSLSEAITKLENDSALRQAMALKGKAFAERNCSEANVAAHFRQWISELSSVLPVRPAGNFVRSRRQAEL